jgi:hypothetical protein
LSSEENRVTGFSYDQKKSLNKAVQTDKSGTVDSLENSQESSSSQSIQETASLSEPSGATHPAPQVHKRASEELRLLRRFLFRAGLLVVRGPDGILRVFDRDEPFQIRMREMSEVDRLFLVQRPGSLRESQEEVLQEQAAIRQAPQEPCQNELYFKWWKFVPEKLEDRPPVD